MWWTLLSAAILQALIITVMAWVLAPIILVLLLRVRCPRALMAPVINAAVTGVSSENIVRPTFRCRVWRGGCRSPECCSF